MRSGSICGGRTSGTSWSAWAAADRPRSPDEPARPGGRLMAGRSGEEIELVVLGQRVRVEELRSVVADAVDQRRRGPQLQVVVGARPQHGCQLLQPELLS